MEPERIPEQRCGQCPGERDRPRPPDTSGHEVGQRQHPEDDTHRAHERGERKRTAGEPAGPQRRFPTPQQGDEPGDEQRVEQRFRHDEMLDVHLVGVEENRRRRQCRDHGRDAASGQKCIEGKPEQQTKSVLHGGHHPQLTGHGQCTQHNRIARGPNGIRGEVPGQLEVRVGVAGELERRAVGDHRQHPQCAGQDNQNDYQAVPPQMCPAYQVRRP